MRFFISIFLVFGLNTCLAQTVFTEEEFISVLKKYHPVAKAASLQVSIARADLLSTRGAFDPALEAENAQKDFGGIAYYNVRNAGIKIPTWYGIDLYAGVENITGARTNPDQTLGSINYVGVNLPLLQNLVMDKRRAALQQAKLMINETEAAQQSILNDLIREGLHIYWQWWQNYHLYNLIDSSLINAEKRFGMVKAAFELGDRPAIDTIEALTQIQSFSIEKANIYSQLLKFRLELSAYLWTENNTAFELPNDIIP